MYAICKSYFILLFSLRPDAFGLIFYALNTTHNRRHFISLMNLTKLNNRIEVKKKELIHLVEKYGFAHDKVISLSQDLDRLLNLLTKLNTSVSRRSNPANKEKRCSF